MMEVMITLFSDIAGQLQLLAAIGLVGASNCYGRIVHAIGLLLFQCFGTNPSVAESVLEPIQEM